MKEGVRMSLEKNTPMNMSDSELKFMVIQLKNQVEGLQDLHDLVLEMKYNTNEMKSWRSNSEQVIKQVSDNFVQVSITMQQITTNLQYTTQEVSKLSQDVENLKSGAGIKIKDIMEKILFAILGAFLTFIIAAIGGSK